MKPYLLLTVALSLTTILLGQYNVKAYIIKSGQDTTWGQIKIPIVAEELDIASLSTKISFVDSTNKSKHFKPKDLFGFGIIDDELTNDYVSVNTDDGWVFAKRLADGEVGLFERKNPRPSILKPIRDTSKLGLKPYTYQSSNYFYGKAGDLLQKITIDDGTSYVSNKDISKIRAIIPDITIPDTGITISDLAELMRTYYSKFHK